MFFDKIRAAAEELRASQEAEGYTPQEDFFDTIIRKAHERPVTAADFEEFIGCRNWLLVDFEDMSQTWRKFYHHEPVDVVCEFTLRRVFLDRNKVDILVDIGEPFHGGTSCHIDADELAIRMDAS